MSRPLLIFWSLLLWINASAQSSFSKVHLCHGISYGVAFDIAPDGRFFVTEKGADGFGLPARIKVFDANGTFLSVFYDLSDSSSSGGEAGLLGIALDPNFSSNHFVYAYHVFPGDTLVGGDERIMITRFTEQNNTGTQPVLIFDYDPGVPASIHIGGNIHFRPSDTTHLYVTIGDFGTGYSNDTAAMLDNALGKILRISKYPNAAPPGDNPFYDDGDPLTGNCDWIWSYGHRNAFDFCFGPNDSLYASENGTQSHDEVNLITRGGFYGWPHCEGTADMDTLTLPCHEPGAIDPLVDFPGPPLPALTGIMFYTSPIWPAVQNHLIVSDYNHADLTDIALTNAPAYNTSAYANTWIDASDTYGVVDLMQDSYGCIDYLLLSDSVFGGIYRICPYPDSVYTWSLLPMGPNPFSSETYVSFTVEQESYVNLSLYDARGRLVENHLDAVTAQGYYQWRIDAEGLSLSSGVYFCVMRAGEFNSVLKLVVE